MIDVLSKRDIAAAIAAALLLATTIAKGETLHRGKVHQTTADRYAAEHQLACSYGPWEQVTLPTGATIIRRIKTCVRTEKGFAQ